MLSTVVQYESLEYSWDNSLRSLALSLDSYDISPDRRARNPFYNKHIHNNMNWKGDASRVTLHNINNLNKLRSQLSAHQLKR